MKAISCDMILTSASTRADGSLGLRFSTPELPAQDKTAFFELLNNNLKVLMQPADDMSKELHEVKGEFDHKTPGQRLRGTIFVLWKQRGEPGDYDEPSMRLLLANKIDHIKSDWWLWECDKEQDDGTLVHGTVQADGQQNLIAEETFEAD